MKNLISTHRNGIVQRGDEVSYRHFTWTVTGIRTTATMTHYTITRKHETTTVSLEGGRN